MAAEHPLAVRGIRIEFTRSGTQQRNGKIERRFCTDGERATAAMISAKLSPNLRMTLWAEFASASSIITNNTCNLKHEKPPDDMFYEGREEESRKIVEKFQPLERIGYISKNRKIKTAKFKTDSANKGVMAGYAKMHARDTYRILKTSTNKMVQTRNVRWTIWKPSQPGDDVHMEIEPSQDNDVDLMEDHINYTKYYGEESDENTSEASTDYNNQTDDMDLFLSLIHI